MGNNWFYWIRKVAVYKDITGQWLCCLWFFLFIRKLFGFWSLHWCFFLSSIDRIMFTHKTIRNHWSTEKQQETKVSICFSRLSWPWNGEMLLNVLKFLMFLCMCIVFTYVYMRCVHVCTPVWRLGEDVHLNLLRQGFSLTPGLTITFLLGWQIVIPRDLSVSAPASQSVVPFIFRCHCLDTWWAARLDWTVSMLFLF